MVAHDDIFLQQSCDNLGGSLGNDNISIHVNSAFFLDETDQMHLHLRMRMVDLYLDISVSLSAEENAENPDITPLACSFYNDFILRLVSDDEIFYHAFCPDQNLSGSRKISILIDQ
jgi:hypothetical protein